MPCCNHRLARRNCIINMPFNYAVLILISFIPIYSSAELKPETVVATASHNIIGAIHKHRDELTANPEILYGFIETIVVPHFDVEAISRLVLGRHWRQATTEQRQRFTNAFKRLVIHSYAKALLLYSNEEIQVLPVPAGKQGSPRISVHSIVTTSTGNPVSIAYRLRMKNGGWMIYDLVVEGVSLVLNYKQSFSEQIRRQGLDDLIRSIEEKNSLFKL